MTDARRLRINGVRKVTYASTRISMSLGEAAPWMYLDG